MKCSPLSYILVISLIVPIIFGFILPYGQATTEPYEVIVFDHTFANWDHPAEVQITIPDGILESGWVNITAYCDPDDCYGRAIRFTIDNRGGWIGTTAYAPSQVVGDTILPGETVSRIYNLSSTQFANEETWSGSVIYDFLNQTNGSVGFLTPGIHTIVAFVSSQDMCLGDTQDSWISVRMEFNRTYTQNSGGGGGGGSNTSSTNQSTNPSSDESSDPASNIIYIIIIGSFIAIIIGGSVFIHKIRGRKSNPALNERPYRPN